MKAYELKWPETMEFLEKALVGIYEISVPVQTSITPKPMLAKLLAVFLAADMKTGTQQRQWEAVKSVIEEINEYWDKNKQPCEIL